MAKMSITFSGFADLAADIDRSGGDLHKAVDEALTKTGQYIQSQLASAAAPYAAKGLKGYAEGDMYGTIINDQIVSWQGSVAEVSVGFDLDAKGGWHSIFVMYGTPRMDKDQKVYNAIKGTKTKKEIEKIQQEVMQKYIKIGGE
jgi:hypothetical protein